MKQHPLYGLFLLIISAFFLIVQSSYAVTIDKIVMFGDSLSDTGNIYSLTKKAKKAIPLIPIIPKSPPYYDGRFTNGEVWIEHVAKLLNVPLDNYAYGGAWAEPVYDSWLVIPFGLDMQVHYHLVTAAADFNKANHLYVIWMGGNDYIQGRSDAEYATSKTVASIKEQMEWLLFYGAKNVVVANLPDVGVIPEVVSKGPAFAASVTRLTQLHNRKLSAMMDEEQKKYPQANLILLDVKAYFDDLMTHPDKYLLKNIKDACYTGGFMLQRNFADNAEILAAKEAKIDILNNASLRTAYLTSMAAARGDNHCINPDEYLFWDGIHPTRVVHQSFATLSFTQLYEYGFKGRAH